MHECVSPFSCHFLSIEILSLHFTTCFLFFGEGRTVRGSVSLLNIFLFGWLVRFVLHSCTALHSFSDTGNHGMRGLGLCFRRAVALVYIFSLLFFVPSGCAACFSFLLFLFLSFHIYNSTFCFLGVLVVCLDPVSHAKALSQCLF